MAIVSYNGITLPYPLINEYREEPLQDPEAKTDWFVTRHTVTVQCVINQNYLMSALANTVGGLTSSPVLMMKSVRNTLYQNRKQLSVLVNGQEMIPAKQGSNKGTVDAMNGPQVRVCNYTQLMDGTFLLVFSVVAHYWESPAIVVESANVTITNKPANNVLYNRWTELVSIDNLNYTKRIRQGKYMIRSDNVDGQTADQLRGKMAVVAVPTGFLRESSDYTISPDGLSISYRVVDKEQWALPPTPAFKAEGRYTESTVYGAIRYAECYVKLWGGADTNPVQLLETCIGVCTTKLYLGGANINGRFGFAPLPGQVTVLQRAALSQNLYENTVECKISGMIPAKKKRVQGTTLASNGFNLDTPGSELGETFTPLYTLRGSAGLLLQAAKYYDPSLRNTQVEAVPSNIQGGDNPGLPTGSTNLDRGKAPGTAGPNGEA